MKMFVNLGLLKIIKPFKLNNFKQLKLHDCYCVCKEQISHHIHW